MPSRDAPSRLPHLRLLSRLPVCDPETGELTAVIETPKGSRNKYDYDDGCAAFRLMAVMPEGLAFPHDFGFIPSTLGEDRDPLDVLVFLDSPAVVGCVLTIRLIGAIELRQRSGSAEWKRNDRLLAVALHDHTQEHVRTLDDLRPALLDEVEAFFLHYATMSGKELEVIGRAGPETARELVDQGAAAFTKKKQNGAS